MNIIEGIFEAHLEVKNLRESIHFYENGLGFKLGLFDENRRRAFFTFGNEQLSMISIVEKESPNYRHMAFRIDIENIKEMIPFLKERNIEILPGWDEAGVDEPLVFPWVGTASVFFNDFDGNRLEFVAVLPEGPRMDLNKDFLMLSEWNRIHNK